MKKMSYEELCLALNHLAGGPPDKGLTPKDFVHQCRNGANGPNITKLTYGSDMIASYIEGQEIEDLKSRLAIAGQAIGEFAGAQSSGPGWYTKGEDGMYQMVRIWLSRGLDATNLEKPNG